MSYELNDCDGSNIGVFESYEKAVEFAGNTVFGVPTVFATEPTEGFHGNKSWHLYMSREQRDQVEAEIKSKHVMSSGCVLEYFPGEA